VWVKITTGREPIVDLDGRMWRQYKVSVFTQRWSDGREGGVTRIVGEGQRPEKGETSGEVVV